MDDQQGWYRHGLKLVQGLDNRYRSSLQNLKRVTSNHLWGDFNSSLVVVQGRKRDEIAQFCS